MLTKNVLLQDNKLYVVAHACNPSVWEEGEARVLGYPWLHS